MLSASSSSKRKQTFSPGPQLDLRVEEICACIRQADEYYQAADSVGLATSPLLQFYGTQSLAKAAILASRPETTLIDLKYHGLSQRATTASIPDRQLLETYSADPNAWKVEEEYAVSNDGVFPCLCEAVGDSAPPKGTLYRLHELFRILPDLKEMYIRHYGSPSHCLDLYGEPRQQQDGHFYLHFDGKDDAEAALGLFPEYRDLLEPHIEHDRFHGFRSKEELNGLPPPAVIGKGTIAGEYLIRPHSSGIHRSLSVHYVALFILGNLVRYKPNFWVRVLEGRITGSGSIIDMFLSSAKRRVPNEVLQLIWGETFTFGTPAYLA